MKPLALVTGGTRGIGRAVTEKLARNGFDVHFTYLSNKKIASEIEVKYPNICMGYQFDHANDDIAVLAKRILVDRTPSLIVNNIGIAHDELFLQQSLDSFWKIMQMNLGSTLACCKAFINSMIEKRNGHIINITSVAAIKPKIGNVAYGVSKIAIERFSKTLALETARFNVRVNCVSPAYVQTDLLSSFLADKTAVEFYKAIPMRKVLLPDEVANIVLLLALNHITTTGSVFYVGNGENIVS